METQHLKNIGNLNINAVPNQGVEPAPFFVRFAATFIDGMIIGVALMLINVVVLMLCRLAGVAWLGMILQYVVHFIGIYYYYGFFYSERGASPGKQLFNLRVQDETTGQNVTKKTAFLRESVYKFISAILFGIGFLMAAFRKDSRALHDLMAKTRVVRVRK